MSGVGCHLTLTVTTALPLLGRMEKERLLKPKSCFAIYFGSVFTPRIETKTMDLHHQEQLEEGGGSGGASLAAGMCWQEEGPGDRGGGLTWGFLLAFCSSRVSPTLCFIFLMMSLRASESRAVSLRGSVCSKVPLEAAPLAVGS